MKKYTGTALSLFMTSLLAYLTFEVNEPIQNVVQVFYWIVIAISYPIFGLFLAVMVASKDEKKKVEMVKGFNKGKIHSFVTKAISIANVILMSMVSFFWLPIAYAVTCIVTILFRALVNGLVEE